MVEVVDRVEIEQERRISVLLQNAGCRECRLETVSSAPPDHLPEAPERDAAGRRLGIVSQPVQVALDARRRGAPLNDLPFRARKGGYRRRRAAHQKGISPVSETLERVKGIEPSSSAWKAVALPLSYTRETSFPAAASADGLLAEP